jgi:hypothetical protein
MDECENGAERDGLVGSVGRVERAGKGTRGKAEGRKGGRERGEEEGEARASGEEARGCVRADAGRLCTRSRKHKSRRNSQRRHREESQVLQRTRGWNKSGSGGWRDPEWGEGGGTGKARWSLQG